MQRATRGLGELASNLAQVNIELWHEEDRARSGDDTAVVAAKRRIDALNQQRNDLIEKLDDSFLELLRASSLAKTGD